VAATGSVRFASGKHDTIPLGLGAGWVPQPGCMVWRRKEFPLPVVEPRIFNVDIRYVLFPRSVSLSPRHGASSGCGWGTVCEYLEYAVADSLKGVVLQRGGWARC